MSSRGYGFTFAWTTFTRMENCGQQFLWSKGWGDIDLGQGPGKRKEAPIESVHYAVPGRVLSKMMEEFYNKKLYREPTLVQGRLEEVIRQELSYQLRKPKNYIDWDKAPSRKKMLADLLDTVPGFIQTVVHQKLLGEYAESEKRLKAWIYQDKYPIWGDLDLIFTRTKDTGITILDGKNSKYKDKYCDKDQLRFYALLFFLVYGKIPDRLGFLWYKFPYGQPKEDGGIEPGVDFFSVNKQDLKDMAARVVSAHKSAVKEEFDPNPVPAYCKFCVYESVCDKRQVQRRANSNKRKKDDNKYAPQDAGTSTFSMDDIG